MRIETKKIEITDACILETEVGTNCPQGGDAGHGGRTVFRLSDLGGTSMSLYYRGPRSEKYEVGQVSEITLVFAGDAEHNNFIKALKFALENLGHFEEICAKESAMEID